MMMVLPFPQYCQLVLQIIRAATLFQTLTVYVVPQEEQHNMLYRAKWLDRSLCASFASNASNASLIIS